MLWENPSRPPKKGNIVARINVNAKQRAKINYIVLEM